MLRLEMSMVASIAFCGMGVFSSKEIRCGESLM